MKYQVNLLNQQQCNFDNGSFDSVKDVQTFARGRNGNYTVVVKNNLTGEKKYYSARNNRVCWTIK